MVASKTGGGPILGAYKRDPIAWGLDSTASTSFWEPVFQVQSHGTLFGGLHTESISTWTLKVRKRMAQNL